MSLSRESLNCSLSLSLLSLTHTLSLSLSLSLPPSHTHYVNCRERAFELASKEIAEAKEKRRLLVEDKRAQDNVIDNMADINRKQYSKLLALERKEMQNQKDISNTWVKYIYLLLEVTLAKCKEKNILFHNEDEFSQTIILRKYANELRAVTGLPPYDVIYDPLDASAIVDFVLSGKVDVLGVPVSEVLLSSAEEVLKIMNEMHGSTLRNVPALRGASQIIELAVETLEKELPPAPPSVNELRLMESTAKKEAVSASRLQGIRNRGKPKDNESSTVGKL